jgi:hypothetical protein
MKRTIPIIVAIIVFPIRFAVYVPIFLCRCIVLLWRRHKYRKAAANYLGYINDYFTNLPPRESEFCGDCKHSEISKNTNLLLCLNENCSSFGLAVSPEDDKQGLCYFERK